jgi:hypothetical protein
MATNEYRRHALKCLCIADENTTSPKNKMLLVGMARAWLKLAQRAEQNPSAEILWKTSAPRGYGSVAHLLRVRRFR